MRDSLLETVSSVSGGRRSGLHCPRCPNRESDIFNYFSPQVKVNLIKGCVVEMFSNTNLVKIMFYYVTLYFYSSP